MDILCVLLIASLCFAHFADYRYNALVHFLH